MYEKGVRNGLQKWQDVGGFCLFLCFVFSFQGDKRGLN